MSVGVERLTGKSNQQPFHWKDVWLGSRKRHSMREMMKSILRGGTLPTANCLTHLRVTSAGHQRQASQVVKELFEALRRRCCS